MLARFASDFSDIQTNAPFDIAGRVNQIYDFKQKRLDFNKTLNTGLNLKELRYLFLCQLLSKTVKNDLDTFIDEPDAGFKNLSKIKEEISNAKSLPSALDKLCGLFFAKVDEVFVPKMVSVAQSLISALNLERPLKDRIDEGFIISSLHNSFKTILSLVNLVPKVYKQKFNQDINIPDFKKAVDGLYNVIAGLSQMPLKVFEQFASYFSQGNPYIFHNFKEKFFDYFDSAKNSKLLLLANKKFFELVESKDFKNQAEKSIQLLEALSRSNSGERINYGCPAHYVQTKHGNMVKAIYYWVKKMIELTIYPELPRLLANPEQ